MNSLKIVSLMLCAASCVTAAIVPAQPVYSLFRSQDELGGYHFGYSGGSTSRAEQRDHNGVVRGAYNLIDAEGNIQKYEYISDANGYRLLSGTNLPEAPVATFLSAAPVFNPVNVPQQVEETPEVKAARAEFQAAYDKAAAAAAAAPDTP